MTVMNIQHSLSELYPELEVVLTFVQSGEKTGQYQVCPPSDRMTHDKIFLLSEKEIRDYFHLPLDWNKSISPKRASLIALAYHQNAGRYLPCYWWLRSSSYAFIIGQSGDIYNYGTRFSDSKVGVRPAMWINKNSDIRDSNSDSN
jgi:hypothetical protein